MRREWIEMALNNFKTSRQSTSPSMRREWIEMAAVDAENLT